MLAVAWLETSPEMEWRSGACSVRRRPLHRARGQHDTGPPRPHQHFGRPRGMPLVLSHHFFPFPALLVHQNVCATTLNQTTMAATVASLVTACLVLCLRPFRTYVGGIERRPLRGRW
jgi:hypothetical protein